MELTVDNINSQESIKSYEDYLKREKEKLDKELMIGSCTSKDYKEKVLAVNKINNSLTLHKENKDGFHN